VDEYTDDEAQEASTEEQPAAIDDKYVRKLKDENQSLRQRLRRTELEANFGKDVVELIPEELPLSKWEEFAGKLAERMPKATPTEQNEPAAEEPTQEVAPSGLAAVAATPSSGAPATEELMTTAEIKKLAKSDPQAAARLVNAGKFVQAEDW
jgi:16S rRNA C967 or C1407 C5-methylase (RsmB/RsmF family)